MSAKVQRLRLRLFLEGVEVPVIAAQVQVAPNAPAVCAIQIPPLAEGTRILPRTTVHLFFLDFYESASPFLTLRGNSKPNQQSPTMYEQSLQAEKEKETASTEYNANTQLANVQNERYKLFFAGEVIGFQWTKDQDKRSIVLQCQDLSNYWDYAYQWNNTDLFGPGIKAIFSGGATNLFTDFLEDEGSVIASIIQRPSVQYPKLEGLL